MTVQGFDLDNTLSPSFLSSLYVRTGPRRWVKIAGHLGGQLEFRQVGPNVLEVRSEAGLTRRALERRVRLETGLWRGPYEGMIRDLPSSAQPQVEALARAYSGVRLPIAPLDFPYIFVTVVLSKRADYHRFVLGWCRKIWEEFDGSLYSIAESSLERLRGIGSSYQVLQLRRTVKSFLELSEHVDRLPERVLEMLGVPDVPPEEFILWLTPELARLTLIKGCWGIGPKVADSIVMSTFKASHLIPCDAHLHTVLKRLGLVDEGTKMPVKALCSRYVCDRKASSRLRMALCPRARDRTCVRGRLSYLRKLGGWLQTLTYMHGREYCRAIGPRCGACPISGVCPTGSEA
ncbi:TPA: hypothetical protein EYP44_00685 [Candidatus Bathyarchaeota archaeon]|nr:hypothetical protein [Candidatus Bathyarchaeota archaeon]